MRRGAAWTVGIVLALVLALILLASLPSPVLSPAATITHWWRRVGERGARAADPAGDRSIRAAFRMFGVLAPVAGVAAVAYVVVRSGGIGPHPSLPVLLGVAVVFGARRLVPDRWWLRLRTQAPVPDKHGELRPWKTRRREPPGRRIGGAGPWSTASCTACSHLGDLRLGPAADSNALDQPRGRQRGDRGRAVHGGAVLVPRPRPPGDQPADRRKRRPAGPARRTEYQPYPGGTSPAGQSRTVRGNVCLPDRRGQEGPPARAELGGRGPRRRPPRPGAVPADVVTGQRAPHRGRPGDAVRGCGPGARHRHRHRIGVAVATGGLVVALVAGWFEGRALQPPSRLPGLWPALVGGVGSVAAAVAITHTWGSSAGWTILLGAAVGVATVALQLAVAVATRRWLRRRAAVDTAAARRSATRGRRGARAELGVDVAQVVLPRSVRQLRTALWRVIAISMTLYGFQVDMVKYTAARPPGNARV